MKKIFFLVIVVAALAGFASELKTQNKTLSPAELETYGIEIAVIGALADTAANELQALSGDETPARLQTYCDEIGARLSALYSELKGRNWKDLVFQTMLEMSMQKVSNFAADLQRYKTEKNIKIVSELLSCAIAPADCIVNKILKVSE